MIMLERNPPEPVRTTVIPQPSAATGGGLGVKTSRETVWESSGFPEWSTDGMPDTSPFASAEDFDVTGILLGVDPCESCYWWMPELYAAPSRQATAVTDETSLREDAGDAGGRLLRGPQAARTSGSRSTAAA